MKRFALRSLPFALLAVGLFVAPKAANATTITEVADSSSAGTTIAFSGSGSVTLSGGETGMAALSYSTDWIEFTINPSSGAVASVVVNSVTPYPNSTFEIGTAIGSGNVLAAQASDNNAHAISLTSGVNYYMSFNSSAPSGTGSQSFGITAVATPESSSLGLLGLGLVGLFGMGLAGGYRRPMSV